MSNEHLRRRTSGGAWTRAPEASTATACAGCGGVAVEAVVIGVATRLGATLTVESGADIWNGAQWAQCGAGASRVGFGPA